MIEQSLQEAIGLGHSYIGTEHLLLGDLTQHQGEGAKILANLGITAEPVREWIRRTVDQVAVAEPAAS